MKFSLSDSKWGLHLTAYPETPSEVALLARYSLNASSERPTVFLDFSSDNPSMTLDLPKRKQQNQRNSINPRLK